MKAAACLLATTCAAGASAAALAVRDSNSTDPTAAISASVWNTTVCSQDELSIITEWRNLTDTQKAAYLAADKCLWDLPAQSNISEGVVTRFDDLVALHQYLTPIIHAVGQFLPYHRLYMKLHEHLLRTECNYTGPMAWWDETQDAGDFLNSVILDPDTGFGGNGTEPDNCVADGPWANTTVHLGPQDTYTAEGFCFKRHVDESFSVGAEQSVIDGCLAETTYEDAGTWCIGEDPHTAGHGGMGGGVEGSIGDIYVSPNDPLFYLHHAFIDRLWWKWQNEDLENRLYAIGGSITYPATSENTTLEYTLELLDLWDNKQVGDVMDLRNSFLCHDYDY